MGMVNRLLGIEQRGSFNDVPATVKKRGAVATQGISRSTRGIEAGLRSFEDNPWLYASVDLIARTCALTPWKVYKNSPKKPSVVPDRDTKRQLAHLITRAGHTAAEIQRLDLEETDHPVLVLLNKPNPLQDYYSFFYTCWALYELSGSLVLYVDRKRGEPNSVRGLYPVPRTWISHWPSVDEPWFELSSVGAGLQVRTGEQLPERDFVVFKRSTARDPYGEGFGLAKVVGAEIDIDEYASKFLGAYFRNSAQPSLLIGVEGADENELTRAKLVWESALRGAENAHRVHWHSGKMSVDQISSTLKDADMIEVRKFERNTLIQVNSIPPECLGIIENSNRSTIDAADYHLRKNVIAPRLAAFCAMLQDQVMPLYGELLGKFLIAPVNPIPEDLELKFKVMSTAPQAFTINEWRASAGYGPIPGGDKPYVETTYQSGYSDGEQDPDKKPQDNNARPDNKAGGAGGAAK